MDSSRIVKSLYQVDPGFVELCKTLFGETVDADEAWDYLYGAGGVAKMSPDPSSMHVNAPLPGKKGVLVPKPPTPAMIAVTPNKPMMAPPSGAKKPDPMPAMGVGKASDLDVVWIGEFSKTDSERRQAFGWASVVEVNGEPVVDLQGDFVTPDEIEKAAYSYVIKSRVGGHQHRRTDDVHKDEPVKVGEMIESFVVTDEKVAKMGLPESMPRGWWVGFQYDDDDTWNKVKNREVTGFSIHGRGKRSPVEI
jgi:hypothetical protein